MEAPAIEQAAGRDVALTSAPADDPRLDTRHWRVFGRRFPRRWSFYFRIVAALLLVLALTWWFTRDVTYVGNVKVSGLGAVQTEYQEPLRDVAEEFAALVNHLADRGYAWQPGGLPALRAADALSAGEAADLLALGTVQIGRGPGALTGDQGREPARFLAQRGWQTEEALPGATLTRGPLQARVVIAGEAGGREQLRLEITPLP